LTCHELQAFVFTIYYDVLFWQWKLGILLKWIMIRIEMHFMQKCNWTKGFFFENNGCACDFSFCYVLTIMVTLCEYIMKFPNKHKLFYHGNIIKNITTVCLSHLSLKTRIYLNFSITETHVYGYSIAFHIFHRCHV